MTQRLACDVRRRPPTKLLIVRRPISRLSRARLRRVKLAERTAPASKYISLDAEREMNTKSGIALKIGIDTPIEQPLQCYRRRNRRRKLQSRFWNEGNAGITFERISLMGREFRLQYDPTQNHYRL